MRAVSSVSSRMEMAALGGAGVDLVVHVGDVADIGDMGVAIEMAQQPEQHVEHDYRPRIADMGEVANRRAADIHPHIRPIERREIFLGLGQVLNRRRDIGRLGKKEENEVQANGKGAEQSAANSNSDLTRNDHAVSL